MGSITPDAFGTLGQLMDECAEKGVELLFFVGQEKNENAKNKLRLFVTVGNPKPAPQRQGGWGNRGASSSRGPAATSGVGNAPQRTVGRPAGRGGFQVPTDRAVNNPPKDPLDKFLEDADS
jgi:hypothetical protein